MNQFGYLKEFDAVTFYDEEMNPIDTQDLFFSELIVPSTPFENKWQGGSDGIPPIFMGAEIQQRPLTLKVSMFGHDVPDYYLLQNRIFEVFGYNQPFYIVRRYESGKRYRAIVDANFDIGRIDPMYGTAEISFITEKLPFAESIGTTQDIQSFGIGATDGIWGYGMGILDDFSSRKYTHTDTVFSIYNAGNVPVDPFFQDLKITVTNVQGANEIFQLFNRTNGSLFTYEAGLPSSKTLEIDGPMVLVNGLNEFRKTWRQFITLDPGWNLFEVTGGATSAKVEFDFRFYYK